MAKSDLKTPLNKIREQLTTLTKELNKPWYKESKIVIPLFLSILIAFSVSAHFSKKTDNTLIEIKNIATSTNIEVKKLSGSIIEQKDDVEIPINKKIVKKGVITPDGTITFWPTLSRPETHTPKGYIFDIGDNLIKNRMSLFVDEDGLLNWKIYESNFNIHTLKYDVNKFLKGEKFFVALTWAKEGELIMYINGQSVSKIKLDKLNLDIRSEEMYWGSDIEGNFIINFT